MQARTGTFSVYISDKITDVHACVCIYRYTYIYTRGVKKNRCVPLNYSVVKKKASGGGGGLSATATREIN